MHRVANPAFVDGRFLLEIDCMQTFLRGGLKKFVSQFHGTSVVCKFIVEVAVPNSDSTRKSQTTYVPFCFLAAFAGCCCSRRCPE